METLDEAKNYIRFLYAQLLEKNQREKMLMNEISSLMDIVSQKQKDAETISILANF